MIKNASILVKFEDDFIRNQTIRSAEQSLQLLTAIMEDVRIILLKNQDIDTRYIENWLLEFDAETDAKAFLSAFRALLK